MTTQYAEDICWAAIDALTAKLPGALAEVQAARTRHPLELPVPTEITLGFDEGALQRKATEYPYIMVIGAPRMPDPQMNTQRVSQAFHNLIVDWVVLSEVRTDAKLIATRYGEAILDVLLPGFLAGWSPQSAAPQVDDDQAVRIGLDPNSASDMVFLCGGTVTIPLKGRYSR